MHVVCCSEWKALQFQALCFALLRDLSVNFCLNTSLFCTAGDFGMTSVGGEIARDWHGPCSAFLEFWASRISNDYGLGEGGFAEHVFAVCSPGTEP